LQIAKQGQQIGFTCFMRCAIDFTSVQLPLKRKQLGLDALWVAEFLLGCLGDAPGNPG
jgi:hypothetical protein